MSVFQKLVPSVIVAGVFSESETIHKTGNRARSTTIARPMLHRVYCRTPCSMPQLPGLPSAMRTPRPFTKTNAMMRTQTKISTDTAEPSPRLRRLMSWL